MTTSPFTCDDVRRSSAAPKLDELEYCNHVLADRRGTWRPEDRCAGSPKMRLVVRQGIHDERRPDILERRYRRFFACGEGDGAQLRNGDSKLGNREPELDGLACERTQSLNGRH